MVLVLYPESIVLVLSYLGMKLVGLINYSGFLFLNGQYSQWHQELEDEVEDLINQLLVNQELHVG